MSRRLDRSIGTVPLLLRRSGPAFLVFAMKKWIKTKLIGLLVTPDRVRRLIAAGISWFMSWCCMQEAWEAVSALPKWLRKLADLIDSWNGTELSPIKDELVADLVKEAITDEQVDLLVDRISSMSVEDGDGTGGEHI